MELLREFHDADIGEPTRPVDHYKLRKAARAVLLDGDNIALLHVAKHGYYKTPGGGVEEGEDIKTALEREILEETGCTARVSGEVGMTIEYRNQHNLLQISYCYLAHATHIGTPSFTPEELADGFALQWTDIDEAIALAEAAAPQGYTQRFMAARDRVFLHKARDIIRSQHTP